MLLDIIRNGSGCGGCYGHWIVDVEKNIAWDVYSTNSFKPRKIINLPDISLLLLLTDCDLHVYEFGLASMDHQEDYVYILNENGQQCVLDNDRDLYPKNEALYGKLLKLIEYLSIECPYYR